MISQEHETVYSEKKRNSNFSNDLNHSKITTIDIQSLPAFVTEDKVMINPKTSEASNLVISDAFEEVDINQYQVTTFYLKRFNILSNSTNLPKLDYESEDEPVEYIPPVKKVEKAKHIIFKNKLKKTIPKRLKRKITCNCKNSSCVKLYCECFSNNGFCNPSCKCKDCKNTVDYRNKENLTLKRRQRTTKGFEFVIEKTMFNEINRSESKVCNCKKKHLQSDALMVANAIKTAAAWNV